MLSKVIEYIRTKFFRKREQPDAWGIDWDEIAKDAAQRLADQIDIDVLDNVYKQVEESALYWCKMKEREVEMQLLAGNRPHIQEWPMFSHETIDKDGSPVTQVVSQCVIGETKLRLDTNFKGK